MAWKEVGVLLVEAEEIPEAKTSASSQIEERAAARTDVISGIEELDWTRVRCWLKMWSKAVNNGCS